MKESVNKKGQLLIGNLVFILLNALFIFVLVLFLLKQGNGAITMEQIYAKEIALSIDYAKPVMLITLDMEKGMKIAEKSKMDFGEAVRIEGNVVRVKLSENSGYTYSFFNDVEARAYPDKDSSTGRYNGGYVIVIGEKTNEG
jgi:lipoprotein signal peptidase